MRRLLALLVLLAACLGGCDSTEDDVDLTERAQARAAEARGYIDDLAASLGDAEPEVLEDSLVSCTPGQDDGLDLIYTLALTVEPDAVERLRGEIAADLEADGWTVKLDPESDGAVSTRFQRGTFTMGANLAVGGGNARVTGSGGCVR